MHHVDTRIKCRGKNSNPSEPLLLMCFSFFFYKIWKITLSSLAPTIVVALSNRTSWVRRMADASLPTMVHDALVHGNNALPSCHACLSMPHHQSLASRNALYIGVGPNVALHTPTEADPAPAKKLRVGAHLCSSRRDTSKCGGFRLGPRLSNLKQRRPPACGESSLQPSSSAAW